MSKEGKYLILTAVISFVFWTGMAFLHSNGVF